MRVDSEDAASSLDTELSDIITFLHYARHHSDEIAPIKEKISQLQKMLNTIEADPNLRTKSDSFGENLILLQRLLEARVTKQETHQQDIIDRMKRILKVEGEEIFDKVASKADLFKDFEGFCDLVQNELKTFQDQLNNINGSIDVLELEKTIDEIKTRIEKEPDRLIAMIKQHNINDCQKQFATFVQLVNGLNIPQYLREQENTAIQRIKDTNAEIEQERKQLEEQRTHIPQDIKDLVSYEITQHEPLINAEITETSDALEKETTKIVDLIAHHKFMADDARIWLDTMRYPTPEQTNCNQEEIMNKIDSAYDEIIESNNAIQSKLMDSEGLSVAPLLNPRKRPRSEDNHVHEKINNADKNIQLLDDYISQFKDAALEPMFPLRIEAAMNKIQDILLNHGTFLACLINPASITNRIKVGNSSQVDSALLHDIFAIVEEQKESTSKRLYKRLKSLEDNIASTL